MRLHQQVIFENEFLANVPRHETMLVDLTLQEVVAAGRVTNPYQLFVLGRLSNFFRMGMKSVDLQLEGPVNYDDESTSVATKQAMLAMPDSDHVKLANYLLDCIQAGESMLHDEHMGVVEWMKFVLQRQD